MERYIKYRRIVKEFKLDKESEHQKFFDDLVSEGWEIIHYNEKIDLHLGSDYPILSDIIITVVVGRKQKIEL